MRKYDFVERKEFVHDLFFNVGYECRCATFDKRSSDLKNSIVSGCAGVHLSQVQDWDKYELICRGYYDYAIVVFDAQSDLAAMLKRAYPERMFKNYGLDSAFVDYYSKVRIDDEFQEVFPYEPLDVPKVVGGELVYDIDNFVRFSSQRSEIYSEIVFCNTGGTLDYNYFVVGHNSGYLRCLAENILKGSKIKDIIDKDGLCVYVPVLGAVKECAHIQIN